MLFTVAFVAFYTGLILWLAWDHKRTWGESLWTALRRDWHGLALLLAVWAPGLFAGGYWLVTGRSALTIFFPGW